MIAMNANTMDSMSLREICAQWKPYTEDLRKAVKAFLDDRPGETKIYWQTFLKLNPALAGELGIDPEGHWDKKLANALSFFYAYHVTGTRKERDLKRRKQWREQKRESNARLAAGVRRKLHHTRIKPIIARREDLDEPAVNPVPEASNGAGLRGTLLRTIEQLQSLLKAIE